MNRKIYIIGSGNVATHLLRAYSEAGIDATPVNPHTLDGISDTPGIGIIAVKDDAITEVASRLASKGFSCLAHTSGSVGLEALAGTASATGVFYPLQTFSKERELTYSDIPFFIEGSSPEVEEELTKLACIISKDVRHADSQMRRKMHVAAVFACNFSNHLIAIADRLLQEDGADYRVLLPLLHETVAKLDRLSPSEAQTGPAARHDRKTMDAHENMLSSTPELRDLYHTISESIIRQS